MTTVTQLQQSHNNNVSILQNVISKNEHHTMKFEKKNENELFLDINKQLT